METRANYILIGLFTLATVLGAFGFVYWFHHVGGTGERMSYRVVFQGPIGGLRAGASVTFNGIRVGEVTELSLDSKDPRNSIATISVEATTPVRSDTEVSLDSQGLTGIAVLALRGGSASAAPVTAKMDDIPLLTAGTSASQDMMAAARDVARRIDAVLVENQQTLKNSLKNVESFTEMLAKNSDSLSKSVKNIESFTDALAKNSEKVDRILVSADRVLGNVDTLTAEKGDVP
jgi:phospholipid/cholesterol/gamma-HCH transport system substrate-binding protein